MTEEARIEHLMRLLPADDAEIVYLDAQNIGWAAAIGNRLELVPDLPDGTPLSSTVTGRRCREDWRLHVTARPGCAWEELEFLRIARGSTPTTDPFDELAALRFDMQADSLLYRN